MTELTNSMLGIFKGSSFALAFVYTAGHVIIAMNIIYFMTGSSLWEAGAVALVEPLINGIWFYVLHKVWTKIND